MKVTTIGKRLVAFDQLAFVELFEPSANPEFKFEKDFMTRVVLLNRDIVLTEQPVAEFAAEDGLHLLTEENVGINRTILQGRAARTQLAGRAAQPVLRLAQVWRDFHQVRVSIARLGDILNTTPEPMFNAARAALPPIKGEITFDHLR